MPPALGSLKAYHRFISWSRKGILFILGGFSVALVSWSSLTRVSQEEKELIKLTRETIAENRMEKPSFSSLSDAEEPYEIWADDAQNITSEQVDLVNPKGKIKDKQGRLMTVRANKGRYTKDKHFLVLEKDVRIKDVLEGHHVATAEAFLDIKNQEVKGNKPVKGEGPSGIFWGERFEASKKTGFLLLKGNPHLEILESAKKDRLPVIVDATDTIECQQEKNVCTATKKAQAQQGDRTVYGDKLLVHLTPGKSVKDREVRALEVHGHVRFVDPLRKAFGNHASYVMADGHMTLTGRNLKILTPEQTLTAEKSIEYFEVQKKAIARGNAVFVREDRVIRADILTAYFKAKGASSAPSTQEPHLMLDYVVAQGHVLISTPQQTARGDQGRYDAATQQAILKGNTEVVQGKNLIQGAVAIVDLQKHTAAMKASSEKKTPARVQVILVPRDLKQQKSFFKSRAPTL